jgi:hypothetical protein
LIAPPLDFSSFLQDWAGELEMLGELGEWRNKTIAPYDMLHLLQGLRLALN